MNVNNLKKDTVYVLTKDFIINNDDLNGIVAVFNKDDKDTIIDPVIDEIQNSETTLTFQVPASSEKWKSTYNPENLYLADGKIFSANFTDSIERERTQDNEDIITIVAYERQKLLEREFVRAWNSTTGFDNIDDFMVVIVSGGDLPLVNDDNSVTTTHEKGTSGYVLDGLLFGTGWRTGVCDVEGVFDLETDQTNIYENILQVQETWGGILVFDSLNKIVHHRDETKWLPYSGFEVRYQKNLQSSKYIGDNKIITYLCPLGEGGLNIKAINNDSLWLVNTEYTNSILKGIENNDNIYEQDQLKRWGERKLQDLCKPRRELTMTTALLNSVEGYEYEEVHLNDIVDVIDFEFVEDRVTQLRVIEYKHYLWSGADAELVIGDITLESTDIFKKTAKATNLINNGTLDTTKVVDYYRNGQSLRKTLRQIDQTITDTKAELELADDAISARVTQTITRVDNLNNDIISQDQKITQLILDVDGLDSKVSTLADLTETITSYNGYIELENAVAGYLLGISVHGYEGSFVATYLSDDTILNDDLYLLGNTVSFLVYTKNNVPTRAEYYELGNIDATTGLKTDSNDYLRNINLIKVEPESIMYFSLDHTDFAFGDVYFYNKYGEYINSWNTLNSSDVITNLSGKQITIPENCYYISYTIQKKIVLNLLRSSSYVTPHEQNRDETNDDGYSYISYDNIEKEETVELELIPDSIPGIKPQLEYGTEKTSFVNFNTKRYEFELDDELREILINEQNIASSDEEDYILGAYDITTGELIEDSETGGRFTNSELIEVLTGEHIHITLDNAYKITNICFYDNNHELLGTEYSLYAINISEHQNDLEFNILSQIKYMTINISIKDTTTPDLSTMVTDANLSILITNSRVYDEFTIVDKNAMLIRRIGVDGEGNKYVLTNPEYHDYGEIEITTVTGLNYIKVDYWTPTIIIEYAAQSKYTDLFATKVELTTQIKQTDEYIELTASKLVSKDGIVQDLNSRLNISADKILIESNKIRIASTYGSWDYDGYFTTTRAKIGNWNLGNGVLWGNATLNGKIYQSGLDTRDNTYMLYAGIDVSDGQTHYLSEANAYITKSGRVYAKWFEVNGESGSFYVNYNSGQIAMGLDKTGLTQFLDNDKNSVWASYGIYFTNNIADGQSVFLQNARFFSITDTLHSLHLAKFSRIGDAGEASRIDFYTTCYINGYPIQTGSSDERLKANIEESTTNALEIIKNIDFYKFDWKDKEKGHVDIGFVAQKLQKQYDKLVIHSEATEDIPDTYQIDLLNTISLTMKGVKELNKKVEDLENENQKLKEKNKNLEERLSKIEKMLNMKSE